MRIAAYSKWRCVGGKLHRPEKNALLLFAGEDHLQLAPSRDQPAGKSMHPDARRGKLISLLGSMLCHVGSVMWDSIAIIHDYV